MFRGIYDILLDEKKDQRLQIRSDIVVEDGSSKLVISRDGRVEVQADTVDDLHMLRSIAQIAVRQASYWMPFTLSTGTETDLATGQAVQMGIYGDITFSSHAIDSTRCVNTVKSLLRVSRKSLSFLSDSTDLLGRYAEVSALTALTALELQLNEIVTDERLQVAQKIAVLEYLERKGVLPATPVGRLRNLFALRNKLAHGVWKGNMLGEALFNVLGKSPTSWLHNSVGVMKDSAGREVVQSVIDMLSSLSNLSIGMNSSLDCN